MKQNSSPENHSKSLTKEYIILQGLENTQLNVHFVFALRDGSVCFDYAVPQLSYHKIWKGVCAADGKAEVNATAFPYILKKY